MRRLIGFLLVTPLIGFALEAAVEAGSFELHARAWGCTLRVAGGSVLLSLAIGLPVGLVLAHCRRALPLALTVLPLLIPPALGAATWMGAGLPAPGPFGCAALLGFLYWPVVAMFVCAAATRIPQPILDAARLHLSTGQTVRRVLWPSIRPAFAAGGFLVFLLAASEFTVPATFAVPTISYVIYERLSTFQFGGALSAMGPLVILAIALATLLRKIPFFPAPGPGGDFLRGAPRIAAWVVAVAAWLLTSILPLAVCIVKIGSPAVFFKTLSIHGDSLVWSGLISAVTAILLVAWAAATSSRSSRLEPLWLANLALPGIIVAFGTLALVNRSGMQPLLMSTGVLLVLASMARFAYAAWLPLRKPVDRAPLEAAELSGLSRAWTARKIVWPALKPRALAVGGILFVLCFGEIGPALLLSPPGRQAVVQHLFNWMHYGYDETVASLSLLLFAVGAGIAGIGIYVGHLHRTEVAG